MQSTVSLQEGNRERGDASRWCASRLAKSCPTLAAPWTGDHQPPLSLGFPRQEYCSGLQFPSPGDLPDPGTEPGSLALWVDSLPSEPPGKLDGKGEMVALWPQRQRSEGYGHSLGIHVTTRGKMQGMELPYSLQGARCPPPWSVPRGTDFGLRASGIVREKTSVILSQEVCANLLESSWETRAVYLFKD